MPQLAEVLGLEVALLILDLSYPPRKYYLQHLTDAGLKCVNNHSVDPRHVQNHAVDDVHSVVRTQPEITAELRHSSASCEALL